MKTQEELKKLKEEYKILNSKLKELSEEELALVTGGEKIPGLEIIGSADLPF